MAAKAGAGLPWAMMWALTLPGILTGCRLAENHVSDPTPRGCMECHADITHQWARGGHAVAWTKAEFVYLTAERTVEECLPCHAPTPVLERPPMEPPELRDHRRGCGVDCESCHRVGCAYAGPYDSHWGPHPMKQERARLRRSDFCGTCHEVEHEEHASLYLASTQRPDPPKQCVDCHMPAYRSRLTQGHILSLAHPKRVVRDHSFPVWRADVLQGAVETSSPIFRRRKPTRFEVRFTLTNRGAGHRIPTGKYGHREMRIAIELLDGELLDGELLDGDGIVLGRREHSLLAERKDGLVPDVPTEFSLVVRIPAESAPARARLLVERVNADRSFRCALIRREWPITGQ